MSDEQDDLFATSAKHKTIGRYPNGPGHRGVDTSVKAAKSVRAQVPFMHTRILSFLVDCGRGGAVYTEIANRCRMPVPTVCGRMKELTQGDDAAVRVSVRRRKTSNGGSARVYVHKDFWNPAVDEEQP